MWPLTQRAEWTVPEKDGLLEFYFEGQDSSAGSVSCCSLLDSQDDLQFLNDLGMKFKTLAEICSPPEKPLPSTPTPPESTPLVATLTRHVAEPVSTSEHADKTIRPQLEPVVETTQVDGRTETLISSAIVSKLSVSNRSTSPPPRKFPRTQPGTVNHSANISQAAALLPQSQTVLLQQKPVYYTTSTLLQPVQYVVQPQIPNMVLLADEAPRANFPGLFVVHGSKNPPAHLQGSACGLVIQRTKHSKNLEGPASPTRPTVVLPVSPGMAHTPGSVEGWKIVLPNPESKANFVSSLVSESSPGVAEKDSVSSQDSLHRGAFPVKKAAPPQESKDQQPR